MLTKDTQDAGQQQAVSQEVEKADKRPAPKEMLNKASKEIGGPKGLEPTRYGDWEKNGRCIDF